MHYTFSNIFFSMYSSLQNTFWVLRASLFYIMCTILCATLYILMIISYLAGTNYDIKLKLCKSSSYIFLFLLKYICGLKYKINNLEKIPNQPSVIMSNHQSFWENIFIHTMLPKNSWIIKKELFNIPILGWVLKILEPIAVDRSANMSVKQILTTGKKKIDSGLSIVLFPEGTRLDLWQTKKFKPSGAKLALLAKTPIVLIAHNAGFFWPKNNFFIKPGTITVDVISILEYDDIKDKDPRDITDQIELIINERKNLLAIDTQSLSANQDHQL